MYKAGPEKLYKVVSAINANILRFAYILERDYIDEDGNLYEGFEDVAQKLDDTAEVLAAVGKRLKQFINKE